MKKRIFALVSVLLSAVYLSSCAYIQNLRHLIDVYVPDDFIIALKGDEKAENGGMDENTVKSETIDVTKTEVSDVVNDMAVSESVEEEIKTENEEVKADIKDNAQDSKKENEKNDVAVENPEVKEKTANNEKKDTPAKDAEAKEKPADKNNEKKDAPVKDVEVKENPANNNNEKKEIVPPKTENEPSAAESEIENSDTANANNAVYETQDWMLILVNPWNFIPDNYKVKLTKLKNNQKVDERIYPELQQMMDDMKAEGLSPYICSSYRTHSYQQNLHKKQINKYTSRGYGAEEAYAEASKWVAVPGTSEHETGLAVDIVASYHVVLDESQEDTKEQQWLMKNSWKYGFILRYPNNKTDFTGIYYEPWHYRYVGKAAAKAIYEAGITLEEYLLRY